MKKRYIIYIIIFQVSMAMAQGNKPSKEQLISKWQSIFGDINFNHDILFDAMVYIGPQPEDSLDIFKGKKLEKWVKERGQDWLNQFFKKPFSLKLDTINPKQYYIPTGKEAGFLYYEWNKKRYHFSMYESYNGFLFKIKNDSIANFPAQSVDRFAAVMTSIFNLRSQTITSFRDEFNFRGVAPGQIFTNVNSNNIGLIRDWQDYIIGFITNNSICVIVFKSSGMRAELGLRYVNDWLNNAIIDEK